MKIIDMRIGEISVPLITPFKTALRTATSVDDIIVEVHTDDGHTGFGEAPPTGVITGDTKGAIIGALRDHIIPSLMGMEIANFEDILLRLESCILHNTSAKAAVDMAIYDLVGQMLRVPVARFLGGYGHEIVTDITISVNSPDEMARDSRAAIARGFTTLKIKVGQDASLDLRRIQAIRDAVGYDIRLRIDANQGWSPKEAVRTLIALEDAGLGIELVEQPVLAHDVDGLKYVTDRVQTLVMADESVFSRRDAATLLQHHAADLINIKLMKTGGLRNALAICDLAETYGVECMIGSMLEAKVAVTAAVHLAAAKRVITRVDLDGPVLCSEDPVEGGAVFDAARITLPDEPGLGITQVRGIRYLP